MAPGALQQRQMISSPSIKPQFNFTFNANENRAGLSSRDEFGNIIHQLTQTDPFPVSGESPPRVIKTHAAIRTEHYLLNTNFDDLDRIRNSMHPRDVENAVNKYSLYVENTVKGLVAGKFAEAQGPNLLNKLYNLMCLATTIRELNSLLRNKFRDCGGTNLLINNCDSNDPRLQYSSARLLVECLDSANLDYVVQHGLVKVMHVVHAFRRQEQSTVVQSKVSTGLLAKLFGHSEGTCMRVIRLQGLDVLLAECQSRDTVTLRNCARALANLSLYGGTEIHHLMVLRHAHAWLFTLAFNVDEIVEYYALLATAVLAADKTIEAAMVKCDTMDLIDRFLATHVPADLVRIDAQVGQVLGQRRRWLQWLVPVLSCDRCAAHTLAAFHFCAEADPACQLRHGEITGTFRTIGAVEPLKKLAGSLNDVASGLAAQALRGIGEQVPRPLSQKVPLWMAEDVLQWAKSTGFEELAERLVDDRIGCVDGNRLLMLNEKRLQEHVGIQNGIMRLRFMRELHKLKQLTDYRCIDPTNLNSFLQSIGPEFSVYTYCMLNAGFDSESIRYITDDELTSKCGITNGIHRSVILNYIKDN
ncbi:PREDICTED: sterile alpha and TIR motif-containing protein 1-like [Diuraphis noxia]|uniref:sterile alpha and TIR motif-containing protein 1-like n=1 Tax=Diuraphis noxia TaxID=143948 RepID=UPI0007637FE3|nr:PREDICTED: sterile alpha and TIR motif-containing protein 1-like [Diuraphis noxia]XP_015373900.1 PREDICTED: sterile alpha and TIR motif-containing protein 1-like [Diuraphis noxia]